MTTILLERVKELKSFFGAKLDDLIEMDKQAAAEDDLYVECAALKLREEGK